ncbi:KRF4 protein, partial [Lophotis ruficrista]|nr:KRF4 protein [Lophotis ruficrista]
MSCYNQCLPCQPCSPRLLTNSYNEPCVRQCQNSNVVVTLPGAILSSFPRNIVVGSSISTSIDSILSCDGVPLTTGCCDLSGISSCYYGRRIPTP